MFVFNQGGSDLRTFMSFMFILERVYTEMKLHKKRESSAYQLNHKINNH